MSETKDEFIYNFYDYMKTIFIYSHVKTYLIDPVRQNDEYNSDRFLLVFTAILLIANAIKIAIIIFYFIFVKAIGTLWRFIKSLFKLRFNIILKTSCKNAYNYITKVVKRIFTFNFNLYQNNYIGAIMISTYLLFLISSSFFYILNYYHINDEEKSEKYITVFYVHFESIFLMQLLCSSFYACRDMKISTICAISIWAVLNAILFVIYFIKEIIENVEGYFENDDFVKLNNIIFHSVFILLNGKSFYNIITYKKEKEYYKLLLEEKEFFYKKIGDNNDSLIQFERKKVENINKDKYTIEKVYYSLDNKNIFKRKDRYNYNILKINCSKCNICFNINSKHILIIIFLFLCSFNIFEIVFNIILFYNRKISTDYSIVERRATLIINIVNIAIIQILATFTVVKLKIETYIFY